MSFRIGCKTDRIFDPRLAVDYLSPFDFVGLNLYHPSLGGAIHKKDPSGYFSSDLGLKSSGKESII
jgi:hypothetical protein